MKTGRTDSRGFTLTELMAVIVIIGVLMALLLPAVSRARERSRIALAKAKMNSISVAIDTFYRDFGYYPPTASAFNPASGRFDGDPYGDFGYCEALVQCLCNRFSKGVGDLPVAPNLSLRGYNRLIGMAPVTAGPYLDVKAEDIIDKDNDGFPELGDAWGNPYIFVPGSDYVQADGTSYNAGATTWNDANGNSVIDPGEFQHYQRFKFQLISLGPDGWTPGLNPARRPQGYRYFNVTIAGNPQPGWDPALVGTDTDLSSPAVDAANGHPDGTADDINNWQQ